MAARRHLTVDGRAVAIVVDGQTDAAPRPCDGAICICRTNVSEDASGDQAPTEVLGEETRDTGAAAVTDVAATFGAIVACGKRGAEAVTPLVACRPGARRVLDVGRVACHNTGAARDAAAGRSRAVDRSRSTEAAFTETILAKAVPDCAEVAGREIGRAIETAV